MHKSESSDGKFLSTSKTFSLCVAQPLQERAEMADGGCIRFYSTPTDPVKRLLYKEAKRAYRRTLRSLWKAERAYAEATTAEEREMAAKRVERIRKKNDKYFHRFTSLGEEAYYEKVGI